MSIKVCLKCRHKTQYEGTPPTACESCGAIYLKVEEALRGDPASQAAAMAPDGRFSRPPDKRRSSFGRQTGVDVQVFADRMRSESLYPTWRELVKWGTRLGYALAIGFLIFGLYSLFQGNIKTGSGFLGSALTFAIATRIWRELSLMVTDLADAAVRSAAQQELNSERSV